MSRNSTPRLTITLVLLLTVTKTADGAEAFRNFWYSPYGLPEYGQSVSQGSNLGILTMVQCSRFCSDDDLCQAFQFHKTDPSSKKGICYTFKSLTYNTIMTPVPQQKYFEKRDCFEFRHFTSGIMYTTELRLILFEGAVTHLFNIIVNGRRLIFEGFQSKYHNDIFPGLVGTVDGAFQGPLDYTYIVQGNQVKCFSSLYPNITKFEACPPGVPPQNILAPYFFNNTRLDAIVALDNTTDNVHIISDNTVYEMNWSGSEYTVTGSYPITDTGSGNIWAKAPENVTALLRMSWPDEYLFIEDYKFVTYSADSKGPTSIFFFCK
ncbi:uncharacterized protein [Haliotis cracherodii]|uniref:uncharacterized protein n=1 Tax=Haliotis cracherodii TaxID=6455 RepID=UPI0039E9EA72